MKNNAYSAIADAYEKLMEVDYEAWADYVTRNIKRYAPGNTGADAGCGSGAFTRRFRRAGLDVYGVDASSEMLSAAACTAREEGLDITYIMQDIRAFRAKNKLHFITALTDCVNYLNGEDMKKTFRRFSDALARGGAFIFDISSEYKLREIIADNMFGEDCDDYAYLWFNRPFDGGVEMDITYFKRLENGLFERSEERHVQYVHTVQSVSAALDGAGFELVKTEGHLGEKLSDKSERINFIAIKR